MMCRKPCGKETGRSASVARFEVKVCSMGFLQGRRAPSCAVMRQGPLTNYRSSNWITRTQDATRSACDGVVGRVRAQSVLRAGELLLKDCPHTASTRHCPEVQPAFRPRRPLHSSSAALLGPRVVFIFPWSPRARSSTSIRSFHAARLASVASTMSWPVNPSKALPAFLRGVTRRPATVASVSVSGARRKDDPRS